MEPGYCTEVQFIRAVDGDTIEVEVTRKFKIRILGIDVAEKNTELGKRARSFVNDLLKQAKRILIHVPTNNPTVLTDIASFERILANIEVDGVDLKEVLHREGFDVKQ